MKRPACSDISDAQLVAYADGDLPPSEMEKIERHMVHCPDCGEAVVALQRSLGLVKTMWFKDELQWQKHVSRTGKTHLGLPRYRRFVIAAAVFFLLTIGSIGLLGLQLGKPNRQLNPAEVELKVELAALGSQLLAIADLLAQQPGGEDYAVERYQYVIEHYQDKREAAQDRLQTLLERNAIP